MKCPKCQSENKEGAKFCNECGSKLSTYSTASSQILSFDDKIDKIQRYLPKGLTEKILAQRSKIEGENKQVTVMFCDMEGFTPLVEKLGREKAYSIMDEVYEILIHKVHDYEGTVNEMTGDGIMALFGAPIALEDAPQRALRSALAIHSEIVNFNGGRKDIDPIKMRIGVHTGPVVVGTLGNDLRVEFKAVGDTVNVASRMEGLAEPGSTYLTEDTFKLTEELFRFEALGKREIKGKEKVIPVYKLLSAKKDVHRPRLGVERSIYSEMVGRDRELDKLEFQLHKAIQGEGSIVNIIGEAGIGKSRLVAELMNCDVIKKVFLLEGRAISAGRNLSFHPIIDFLKQWAKISEDDSGVTALSKLESAIHRVVPEDLHEILPFVATLMGMKLSGRYAERVKDIEGEALEKLIFKNMRDLITKATELIPHVIVMEDLHWADTSSIELTESLFRLAETQKIVFINVFRPGHEETGDRIIETTKERFIGHYVEIYLHPLDEKMSEALINNMLQIKGLKHAVINQIVKRADGNPFFIEEVVRSFIDQGAVVQKDRAFMVTEKIDMMVIPHTINDVLMARIDRLEEKTRDIVKIASVIGRNFFYKILKEVLETTEDIDNRVSYLKDIQLIRERKRMDELEYLFKHALAQEAAYESILSDMRRGLHLKVANSIEKVFEERLHDFYGMLAYHYSKGEDFDKAEEYMIKAGEAALGSSASSEALRYYQNALEIYQKKFGDTADFEKLSILDKNIAIAFFNKGEYEQALQYIDSFLKRLGISQPANKILILLKLSFDLLILILKLYFPSNKFKQVPTKRDREILNLSSIKDAILVFINPTRLFAEVIGEINRILKFDLGKIETGYEILLVGSVMFSLSGFSYRLSKKLFEFGEITVDKDDLRGNFILTYTNAANKVFQGNWIDLEDIDEGLIDENLKNGSITEVSTYIGGYAVVKVNQGNFEEAYQLVEKLLKIADDFEEKQARQWQLYVQLILFINSRKLHDAQKTVKQLDVWPYRSFDISRHSSFVSKAELQILLKDYDGSRKTLGKVKGIFQEQSMVLPSIATYYYYASLHLDINLLEESIFSDNKSKTIGLEKRTSNSCKRLLKKASKDPYVGPQALSLIGRYYWLVGKQDKAVKIWKKAIGEGERLGTRPALARTYIEVGKRFLEEKSRYKELNEISAEEYLEKARTMFQEMDLQWDLDELDKITMTN